MIAPRAIYGSFLAGAVLVTVLAPAAAAQRGPRGSQQGCEISGGPEDDRLEGTPGGDVICGFGGNDVIIPRSGRDVVRGGRGRDTVSYADAGRRIHADLGSGRATGQGPDALTGVEDLRGSPQGDVLWGNGGKNALEGGGGTDILHGRKGKDRMRGQGGPDFLEGGEGRDPLDGGPGTDRCDRRPFASCFGPGFRDPDDTQGPLDIGRVRMGLKSRPPTWTILTRRTWSLKELWDDGYFLVHLDTKGGPSSDFYALVRSTGRKIAGTLHRAHDDHRLRNVPTGRAGPRGVRVRVPIGDVPSGNSRDFFRWSVTTLYTGESCARVCFDSAPRGGSLPHPLPG
jgi:RTX calcium-binding nonapeptide repeat (4 copies)